MALVASTAPLVYALAAGAVVLGIVLLATGVRLVIATRTDPEALATLEEMSRRTWRPADASADAPAESSAELAPPTSAEPVATVAVPDTLPPPVAGPVVAPPPGAVVEVADVEVEVDPVEVAEVDVDVEPVEVADVALVDVTSIDLERPDPADSAGDDDIAVDIDVTEVVVDDVEHTADRPPD